MIGGLYQQQRILWVTGKGGVGKSLLSLGLAHHLAGKGEKVLLVELGDGSYFQSLFRDQSICLTPQSKIGHQPVQTRFGFDLACWSGESCLREYILHLLKIRKLYDVFFNNQVMRTLVNVAPGLSEIAITGKITSGLRHVGPPIHYDRIVVDTFATGHALALWRAPLGLKTAVQFGPMGNHAQQIDASLRNPDICKYIIVTLLEELPVSESLELAKTIQQEVGIEPEVVANRHWNFSIPQDEMLLAQKSSHPLHEFSKLVEFVTNHQRKLKNSLEQQLQKQVQLIPQWWTQDPIELMQKTSVALV